jgi:hypothetical protein
MILNDCKRFRKYHFVSKFVVSRGGARLRPAMPPFFEALYFAPLDRPLTGCNGAAGPSYPAGSTTAVGFYSAPKAPDGSICEARCAG